MKLSESFFVNGRRVGAIVQDAKTGAVDFLPSDESKRLPRRTWSSVDELRDALTRLYGEGRPQA